MDYEKEYKSLVAKVKKAHQFAQTDSTKSVLEDILPQLRESEDERINKFLRHTFTTQYLCKDKTGKWHGEPVTNILAYLEKKEQPISAEEVLARAGLKPYKDGNQWCILAGDNIQEGICGFGDTIEDALYEFLKEVLDLQKEQKPAWSEEDEKQLDDIISIIRGAYEHGITISETRHRNAYFWLNNLRPSWKPSEEQMEELWNVISYIEKPSSNFLGVPALLESLYEQLQKLM